MKVHPFHQFPVHLYHKTKKPVIAHDADTEAAARADGYGDDYIHQDDATSQTETVVVNSQADLDALKAKLAAFPQANIKIEEVEPEFPKTFEVTTPVSAPPDPPPAPDPDPPLKVAVVSTPSDPPSPAAAPTA